MPAVDLRAGKVVRLLQGDAAAAIEYGSDPAGVAREWQRQGAERLHLVDLDAALDNRPQTEAVAQVLAAVSIPVELGGGVRRLEDVRRWRAAGVSRVVLGTAAVTDPELLRRALDEWPEGVAVALDARDGRVSIAGWREQSPFEALEFAGRLRDQGVSRVQYTDVRRDGTLGGPDLQGVAALARLGGLRITAAGGIAGLADVRALRVLEPSGVDEVIVGKALYEGCFTLAEACAAARGEE